MIGRMSEMALDLQLGWRGLARKPIFTLVAVATLAVGIGSVTAVLSVMNGTFRHLFPYKAPQRLVVPVTEFKAFGQSVTGTSAPLFKAWRDRSESFESLTGFNLRTGHAAYRGWDNDADSLKGLVGLQVLPNFFATMGMTPAMGRVFSPEEDRLETHPVIVLSDHVWRNQYAADPKILEKTIKVEGYDCHIIGVMPPNYRIFPPTVTQLNKDITANRLVDYWIPFPNRDESNPCDIGFYEVIGRLKPKVSAAQAEAELAILFKEVKETYGNMMSQIPAPRIEYLTQSVLGSSRSITLTLLLASIFVLLIACVNIANLLAVRALERQHEMSIRIALGCGRGRLAGQIILEILMLALAGGIGGILLAHLGINQIMGLAPRTMPGIDQVRMDPAVAAVALAVTLICGLTVGLVPVLRSIRPDLMTSLKQAAGRTSPGRKERRLLEGLVCGEVALSFVLLIAAGLMIHSFWKLAHVDLGLNTDQLLSVTLMGPDSVKTKDALMADLKGLPGVQQVAVSSTSPLGGYESDTCAVNDVSNRGQDRKTWPVAGINTISHDSLSLFGIRLLQGRYFDLNDGPNANSVVVVNRRLAETLWPGQDPIGREMAFRFKSEMVSNSSSKFVNRVVVGVVDDVRNNGPDKPAPMTAYLPDGQAPRKFLMLSYMLKCAGDPKGLIGAVRSTIAKDSPASNISSLETMDDRLGDYTANRRFLMTLLICFGASAFGLAVIGLYGVISQSVARRTGEIAIRMALGAQQSSIRAMILRQGIGMLAFGMGVGLVLAVVLRKLIAAHLFGVAEMDPLALMGAVAVLSTAAVAACLIPVWRASRVDPMTVLRAE